VRKFDCTFATDQVSRGGVMVTPGALAHALVQKHGLGTPSYHIRFDSSYWAVEDPYIVFRARAYETVRPDGGCQKRCRGGAATNRYTGARPLRKTHPHHHTIGVASTNPIQSGLTSFYAAERQFAAVTGAPRFRSGEAAVQNAFRIACAGHEACETAAW
jgi:hypothetical protein